MDIEHIPDEAVKAYLLGQLEETEASEVERRYFVGRCCLEKIGVLERTLIEDYLDGRLPAEQAKLFENRYLKTPCLKKVVEGVRQERNGDAKKGGANRHYWWRRREVLLAVAGALACLAAVSIWVEQSWRPPPPVIVAEKHPANAPESVRFQLTPGVSKTASVKATRMGLPPPNAPVILVAQLPGAKGPVQGVARLSAIGADDQQEAVWSGTVQTRGVNGEQQFAVTLAPSTLKSGDYTLEVKTSDGRIDTTYIFGVIPPQ